MVHHIDCQFMNMEKSVTCFFTEKQNHLSQLEMPPKPGIDLFLSLSLSCWCVHYSRNIKKRFRITQNRLKLKSQLGLKPSYVSRILSLNNLAPDIVEAIVEGNEPDGLSIEKISRNIPEDWAEQRKLFGFPAL